MLPYNDSDAVIDSHCTAIMQNDVGQVCCLETLSFVTEAAWPVTFCLRGGSAEIWNDTNSVLLVWANNLSGLQFCFHEWMSLKQWLQLLKIFHLRMHTSNTSLQNREALSNRIHLHHLADQFWLLCEIIVAKHSLSFLPSISKDDALFLCSKERR